MNADWHVAVHDTAAISLGNGVICDGYLPTCNVRVQTHAHSDHTVEINRSLGNSDEILLAPGTRDLLIAEQPPLEYRSNLKALDWDQPHEIFSRDEYGAPIESLGKITLTDANHMLGSSQVVYERNDGFRTGYTGDFGWPVKPIEVDQLVLDGTSSPKTIRHYSQDDAENELLDLVDTWRRSKNIVILADLESMYRAVQVLNRFNDLPVIMDERGHKFSSVYEANGVFLPTIFAEENSEYAQEIRNERHVFVVTKGKRNPYGEAVQINLIPFFNRPDQPVFTIREGVSYQVGLTNHADFVETMQFLESSDFSHVLIDNVRGSRAEQLRIALTKHFPDVKFSTEIEFSKH